MTTLAMSPELTNRHNIAVKGKSMMTLEGLETQVANKQDMVRTGKHMVSGKYHAWMVVADGHGVGTIINAFKSADWNVIMEGDNTMALIYKLIGSLNTDCDGATLSVVKITPLGIKSWWIGDSQIRIFNNHKLLWKSANHNSRNEKEMKRIRESGIKTEASWTLSVIDRECLGMKRSRYIHHVIDGGVEKLAMTRVLGHNNGAHPFVESHFIPFNKCGNDAWKVVVASDGLWDMVGECDGGFVASERATAATLTELALKRWLKEWIYVDPTNKLPISVIKRDPTIFREKIQGCGDDIGVAVWSDVV